MTQDERPQDTASHLPAKAVAGLRSPIEAEVAERLAWLIRLRWLAVVGTLAAIAAADQMVPGVLPLGALIATTGFIAAYNLGFHLIARRLAGIRDEARRALYARRFIHFQVVLDLLCLTVLLHFAGGIDTPFWAFYVLHIIIASILLSPQSAYAYVAVAAVFYGAMVLLEFFGIIPHVYLNGLACPGYYARWTTLLSTGSAFLATLFFSAWMATSISTRLRARDLELVRLNVELERRAEELSNLNRRLQEIDEARKRFVRVAAHELRAPVAAIQSYVRLILSGYVPAEKQEEILTRVEQRALELLDRINDLLILSRIQEHVEKREQVNVAEVLQKVVELMRPILADREQIQHVWMNLISNAIKYTPAGGYIEVTLSHRPTSIIGSVRDSGIGIAPEDQEKIFQEFYRTEEAKQIAPHGTGLGLSIVKQIVEGLGGRIWVSSAPGKGAKFTFVLPRSDVAAPAE
jgi:signal transduction histidine kinase